MKKAIVILMMVGVGHFSAQGQDIAKEIFGKWKLDVVEMMGEKGTPQEVFGVAEAYQEYSKPNKFKGFLGEEVHGDFTIDSATSKIVVTVGNDSTEFKVISFTKTGMILSIQTDEGALQLHYKKS